MLLVVIRPMPRAALVVVLALFSSGALAAEGRHASGVAALFAQLEKADAVVEGARDSWHLLYVFFDANCYYCHLTWKALQPYEAVGLQVRWVPVAYQQPSSVGRAAAIMESPDRVAALRRNETGYDRAHFDGAIAPLAKVTSARTKSLEANTKLMRAFGAPGTPALVWKDANANVQFRAGVPRLSELPALTGLPAQRNDDPELAPFR
jgi:thiol:disulfide interchange protein DsbG